MLAERSLRRERLDRLWADIVEHWVRNRIVLSAMIETAEYDEQVREVRDGTLRAVAAITADYLTQRWAGWVDGPADIEGVSRVLVWMLERSCHQVTRQPCACRKPHPPSSRGMLVLVQDAAQV
jgi:hypothetical protein